MSLNNFPNDNRQINEINMEEEETPSSSFQNNRNPNQMRKPYQQVNQKT